MLKLRQAHVVAVHDDTNGFDVSCLAPNPSLLYIVRNPVLLPVRSQSFFLSFFVRTTQISNMLQAGKDGKERKVELPCCLCIVFTFAPNSTHTNR